MIKWGPGKASASDELELSGTDRCLTLLADGAARGIVEIDKTAYRNLRENVDALARRLPDRLPDDEKLGVIRAILTEFDAYRSSSETSLREQKACWRGVLSMVIEDLFHALGVNMADPHVEHLVRQARRLESAAEIQTWRNDMDAFLHPANGKSPAEEHAARLRAADQSTTNDNAAGLRGGGAAVEHLKRIMEADANGFIVTFRLSCLDIISQRFGAEAVEDCLMSVSASITAKLHGDDAVYHWSDSSLLAILQGRASEMILGAELERIIAQNRESTIHIAGRSVMLRIPISFEITPIHNLRKPEDLLRLSARKPPPR